MNFITEMVIILSERLPELEWKLNTLNILLYPQKMPKGMFSNTFEMTPQSCVQEIKADLETLKCQKNEQPARFMANRISEKINVLVRICKIESAKKTSLEGSQVNFGVKMISTRQQWLQTIQTDIATLTTQEKALNQALLTLKKTNDAEAILNLQREIGEVNRRLTLAKETCENASQFGKLEVMSYS